MAPAESIVSQNFPRQVARNRNALAEGHIVWNGSVAEASGRHERARDLRRVRRIAIADDEEDLGRLFSMMVTRLGYINEFVARDGTEIVRAIADGTIEPDLILMDYRMPRMNGLQAAKKILKIRPAQKIIMVTADDKAKEQISASGLPFVQKPFYMETISRAIEDAFR